MKSIKRIIIASLVICVVGLPLRGQCPSGVNEQPIAASPTRPVITDSAEVVQTGVVEVESGWASGWPGGGVRQDSFGSLYKIGMFCNFELRASSNVFQDQVNANGSSVIGMGDIWYSGQYRFLTQKKSRPSVAMIYSVKQATASSADGLGSGQVDQLVALAADKNVGKTAVSFESKWIMSGRQLTSGVDKNGEISINVARALTSHFGVIGEVYGDTQKNAAAPGFASNLYALQYQRNSRLIFDAGIDLGISNGAPHKRVFAGVSYALGDLYGALRH